STVTRPAVGSTRPMMVAIVVVLPAPLPPSSAVMLPGARANEMPATAVVLRKVLTRRSTAMAGRGDLGAEQGADNAGGDDAGGDSMGAQPCPLSPCGGREKGSLWTATSVEQANRIIAAILARGGELDCRPLSVIVVEPGCKVKAFQKEDGSSMIRFEMAFGKAYAALALGRASKLVRVRAQEKPLFMDYLIAAGGAQILPGGGGALIGDAPGEVIGAVGVTGDTEDRDEDLAAHGIRAAGLKTDDDCETMGRRVNVRKTKKKPPRRWLLVRGDAADSATGSRQPSGGALDTWPRSER